MGCCKHECFITLQTLADAAQVTLPDSARIRDGKVTSIQLRRAGSLTLKTYQGTTIVADTVIATAHIWVKNLNGQEIAAPIPLQTLQRDYNSPEPLKVDWSNVDLTQSTIVLDTTGVNAGECIEIIFGLDCTTCK